MTSNFPGSADNIQNNVTNSTAELDTHPTLHNKLADAVNAVETALLPGGTMNLAAHVAAADPHTIYLTQTEGDARYSTIAGGGTVPDGSVTLAKLAANSVDSSKIVDGTIDTADLKDSSVTSAKILDGTIATADLANASVTNAKLASDTARANLLTNGGFEIWQRGAGPFTGTGTYSADRWISQIGGTSTLSVSRDGANIDSSAFCAACTYVHNVSTNLQQKLEDLAQLKGKTISLSVRVRTTTANAVRIGIWDSVNLWRYSAYHSGSGTYETLVVSGAIATGATLILPSIVFDASCTAYLDNAMLVVGSVPADYAPLQPPDDLARCLRYYEILGDTSFFPIIAGYQAAGGIFYNSYPFRATKAIVPTMTKVGTWTTNNAGQPSSAAAAVGGFTTQITVTATGSGYATPSAIGQNFSAEANP